MPTGLAIAVPLGFAGFVVPRSGLALKHGITLVNTPGIIDSGYRGELKVVMINTKPTNGKHWHDVAVERIADHAEVMWVDVEAR